MHPKKLVPIFTFTLAICISNPYTVSAGGPPPSTGTTASLKGVVRFEGTAPKPKVISMCRPKLRQTASVACVCAGGDDGPERRSAECDRVRF